MSKRVLVTGGTGFLGSALVKRLAASGHAVRVLDDDSRGASRRLAGVSGVEQVSGDVRDPVVVARAVAGVDAVWHLASVNGTEHFYSRPELVLEVGVKGIMNVLDGCLAHGVGELFVASSSEVYQTAPVVPTDESVPLSIPDPLNPRYSYAAQKLISEILAVNYGRKHFSRVVIFRPHNVYGPDMGGEHVIPQLVLRMRDACAATPTGPVRFEIQGDGAQTRAFIYVDDFIDALEVLAARGEHRTIYHVGSMEETAIGALARAVGRHFGREIELVTTPEPAGGTRRRCPDTARLAGLGFATRTSLADGLARTARWYVEHASGVRGGGT